MKEFARYGRAEILKMRHTLLPVFHLVVPALGILVFLVYFRVTAYDWRGELSGYIAVLTAALPFIISIVCSLSVSLEEKNHFCVLLGTEKKGYTFWAKWLILSVMGLGATALAVFGFMAGYSCILGKCEFELKLCMTEIGCMWLCSQGQYLIHLCLNFCRPKSASLCVGAAESLLSALMMTGLGDGIWQFFPCAFGVRWSEYLFRSQFVGDAGDMLLLQPYYRTCFIINAAVLAGIGVSAAVYFHFYEGRRVDD